MYHVIGLVASIGLADSLNPSTIAPALYLASGEHARRRVTQFTLGVFIVYLAGGAVIALGPGELLLDIVPHPHHIARHIVETIAGAVMLVVAALVWRNRRRLTDRAAPDAQGGNEEKSSLLLGATITAVELPTAFPYFAAISIIVGAGPKVGPELVLLVLFNICFVLPLLVMIATLWLAGDRATEILGRWRDALHRRWPVLVATAALLAGAFSLFVGISGLLVAGHGRISGIARHLRKLLHLSAKP
jgi:cytochrome c biogenesis protein CcdA